MGDIGGAPIAMPPPSYNESTTLTADSKPMYGLDAENIDRKGDDFS